MNDSGQTNDPAAEVIARAVRLNAAQWQGYSVWCVEQALKGKSQSSAADMAEAYDRGRNGIRPDAAALAQAREEGRNDVLQLILAMQREQRQYAGDCELCHDDPQKPHEYVAVILERLQHQFTKLDPPSRACNATP